MRKKKPPHLLRRFRRRKVFSPRRDIFQSFKKSSGKMGIIIVQDTLPGFLHTLPPR